MTPLIIAALTAITALGVHTAPPTAVGTVLVGGVATHCKPTPRYCQGWGEPAMLGAMPTFRFGDPPFWARVRSGGRSVKVKVVSFCACGDRRGKSTVIDLSPAAFRRLAPLGRGVIDVTVEYPVAPPGLLPPSTDTAP